MLLVFPTIPLTLKLGVGLMTDNLPATRGDLQSLSPMQLVETGTQIADALAPIVEKQKLYTMVGKGKHVNVEGWTTMGAMLGITPRERDVKYIDGEYEAYVELVSLRTGMIVGGASAICGKSDPTWAGRPRNAQRSMAITRATGKAYRLGYSWIMKLAGYEATPAEEMDHLHPADTKQQAPQGPPKFNARSEADVFWIKDQLGMLDIGLDHLAQKKVALIMHDRPRSDFQKAVQEFLVAEEQMKKDNS